MITYSVDTNVLVRFFIKDDSDKTKRIHAFFEKAKRGKHILFIDPYSIMELAYALSRYYKLPKQDVCEALKSILSLMYAEIPNRKEIADAVGVYEMHGVDFIDALLFIRAKN